jgi:iron complex outermembrane receptor protein
LGPNSTDPVRDSENTSTFVTEIPNRLISGFARFNYTFKDRYLLTFTVRRDGSSRFGPENQWGTFPSAALAWRAHQETFIQDIDWLSNLKLRGSWGVTGNQEIGDFLFSSLWTPGGPQAQVQFGDEFVSTIRPSAADETLKWEETTTWNVGFDYGLFDGRISGSFEYYIKDTDDLLFTVPAAGGSNLSDRILTNIGEMRNKGFEFSVDGLVLTTEDFSWNAQFNASTNDNELLSVRQAGEGITTGFISGGVGNTIQIIQEGAPINSFFVLRHKENENGEPVSDNVDANGDGVADDLDMYVDQNGDGVINQDDRVVGESPQPDWILGHTSRFTYRNFDLSLTLRAHLGNHVYNNVASNFGHYSRLTNFAPSNLQESVLETNFTDPQFFSDYYVEDASFLRLDNVSLGYTFDGIPSVDRIRVFGTAQNLFVLSGYSGPDPEVVGIDNNLYPRSRTFTAGVNVQL